MPSVLSASGTGIENATFATRWWYVCPEQIGFEKMDALIVARCTLDGVNIWGVT